MSLASLLSDERAIICRLLDDAAARGLLVSVFDGEEWSVTASENRKAIEAAVGATDTTTLRFRRAALGPDGKPSVVGSVFLVHGNGADVLADWSESPDMLDLLSGASSLAEALV